jgi:beta-phosphoglucomutase-like phosphatase (HAD superfamily)
MLAIFDNDGTICDTQESEGRCFSLAIERVTGRPLASTDWTRYSDPTSTSMVRELLIGDIEANEKEERIKSEFCRLLREEQPKFPHDFSPIPGAVEFLERLEADSVCALAIATGCFDVSARFKLECCGVRLDRYPYATASDTPRRSDIIQVAASRAGFDLASVVYFGDAPWDARASAVLGIPMIGIGRRWEQLRDLGVRYTFRDYTNPDRIIDALAVLRTEMPRAVRATHDGAPA